MSIPNRMRALVLPEPGKFEIQLEAFAAALDTFVHRREGAGKVVIEPNGPEA